MTLLGEITNMVETFGAAAVLGSPAPLVLLRRVSVYRSIGVAYRFRRDWTELNKAAKKGWADWAQKYPDSAALLTRAMLQANVE